jgi:uncharacterized protein (UPF0262 family)
MTFKAKTTKSPTPRKHAKLSHVKLAHRPHHQGGAGNHMDVAAAIRDLLENNAFKLANGRPGPYRLALALREGKLVLEVGGQPGETLLAVGLSLTPFKSIVRDYFAICESYDDAVREGGLARIEAVDMARRGLHNEAGEILRERLAGKIELDLATARRLFTLVCALLRREALP